MRSVLCLSALLLALAACGDPPATPLARAAAPHGDAPATWAPRPRGDKPTAAVDLDIDAQRAGANLYDVTLRARPRAPGTRLELELVLPEGAVRAAGATRLTIASTALGQEHTLTARIRLERPYAHLVGGARVIRDGRTRTAAVGVDLGAAPAPAPQRPARTVVLPDGVSVAEVRP